MEQLEHQANKAELLLKQLIVNRVELLQELATRAHSTKFEHMLEEYRTLHSYDVIITAETRNIDTIKQSMLGYA